jgi:hypothetical protein
VSILIIGRTTEENLNFTTTLKINALTGVQDHSLTTIEMAVLLNIIASIAMDGKNKSIILKTTS